MRVAVETFVCVTFSGRLSLILPSAAFVSGVISPPRIDCTRYEVTARASFKSTPEAKRDGLTCEETHTLSRLGS